MTLVGSFRARRVSASVRERAAAYAAVRSDDERRAVQLELLNESWAWNAASVPHWSQQVAAGALPARFESLEEFVRSVPVMDRRGFRAGGDALVSRARPPQRVRITGGSTAEPVQMPSWRSEFAFARPDMWLARSWYGIRPDSPLFLLWGHTHLLGSGWRGWLNGRARELCDVLLGYRRFSAYDLGREALRRAADALLEFRPEFVIGYSVALDLFASANADRRDALRASGVKLVLAAAECFPATDSEARVQDLFGCSLGMEYGAVETSLLAHTHPQGDYQVFWRSYLVDAERVGERHRIRVTSLYPRCTPLVRYDLGDEIEPAPWAGERIASVLRFDRLIGRCNDFVILDDGFRVHSEGFTHAVRTCETVRSYQVVQDAEGLRLLYTADRSLSADEMRGIRERLARIHDQLEKLPLIRVTALERTIAGKTPMVLRR